MDLSQASSNEKESSEKEGSLVSGEKKEAKTTCVVLVLVGCRAPLSARRHLTLPRSAALQSREGLSSNYPPTTTQLMSALTLQSELHQLSRNQAQFVVLFRRRRKLTIRRRRSRRRKIPRRPLHLH